MSKKRSPDEVFISSVCNVFGDVLEENNTRPFPDIRKSIAILLKAKGYSYPKIACLLHRKNHATIIHMVSTARDYLTTEPKDPKFERIYTRVRSLFNIVYPKFRKIDVIKKTEPKH